MLPVQTMMKQTREAASVGVDREEGSKDSMELPLT